MLLLRRTWQLPDSPDDNAICPLASRLRGGRGDRPLSDGSEPKIMTISGEESRDWKEILVDWIAARWRWLIVAIALLFALNNLGGSVVGIMGLIAFANHVVGRVLRTRRVVQQVQQIVTNPDDLREEVGPKRHIAPPDHRP